LAQAMGSCQSPPPPPPRPPLPQAMTSSARQPAVFVNHGGGPMPIIGDGGRGGGPDSELARHLAGLSNELPERPRAVLVVTAHWEESPPAVTGGVRPELVYDYYGFPPQAYAPHLTYSPPGAPDVAARAAQLLQSAGFEGSRVAERGYDHGTFIPMKIAFPAEDVPITQVSLVSGLDPAAHIALGRALAPLRDEGVLVVGSGMSFHNMRTFDVESKQSLAFDAWLQRACTGSEAGPGVGDRRCAELAGWASAPGGRQAHPREEHLMPLLVCAGAAADDACVMNFHSTIFSVPVSGFRFG